MRRASLLRLALLLGAAAGCGGGSSPGPTPVVLGGPCTHAAECQTGLVCLSGKCEPFAAGACTTAPTIALGTIAGPATAPSPSSTCAPPVSPAVFPTGGVVELGVQRVGTVLSFDVPAGTASFTVIAQVKDGSAAATVNLGGTAYPNAVQPTALFAPDGTPFYDAVDASTHSDPSGLLAFDAGVVAATGVFTVPSTSPSLDLVRSAGAVQAGTWTFTLTDLARDCPRFVGCPYVTPDTSGLYDVKVLTRPGPLPTAGTLDLDLYLVSTDSTLTAASAVSGAKAAVFRRYVSGVASVLQAGGVCLGSVQVHDVQPWARSAYSTPNVDTVGPCDTLSLLFGLALPRNAVHVFLVDDLVSSQLPPGAIVYGIDGSIPGPSGVPGGPNSGAAVLNADLGSGSCGGGFTIGGCGTDLAAYVTAHETGHWLGLYHTTESDGAHFDPLTDTAKCECASCVSSSQRAACGSTAYVTAPGCVTAPSCAGGGHLMFWEAYPGYSQGLLSPEEGEVMRLNPAVH